MAEQGPVPQRVQAWGVGEQAVAVRLGLKLRGDGVYVGCTMVNEGLCGTSSFVSQIMESLRPVLRTVYNDYAVVQYTPTPACLYVLMHKTSMKSSDFGGEEYWRDEQCCALRIYATAISGGIWSGATVVMGQYCVFNCHEIASCFSGGGCKVVWSMQGDVVELLSTIGIGVRCQIPVEVLDLVAQGVATDIGIGGYIGKVQNIRDEYEDGWNEYLDYRYIDSTSLLKAVRKLTHYPVAVQMSLDIDYYPALNTSNFTHGYDQFNKTWVSVLLPCYNQDSTTEWLTQLGKCAMEMHTGDDPITFYKRSDGMDWELIDHNDDYYRNREQAGNEGILQTLRVVVGERTLFFSTVLQFCDSGGCTRSLHVYLVVDTQMPEQGKEPRRCAYQHSMQGYFSEDGLE